jgi:hypothetical protein
LEGFYIFQRIFYFSLNFLTMENVMFFFNLKRQKRSTQNQIRDLGELLTHQNPRRRLKAVRELGLIKSPATLPLLIQALRNSMAKVREAAFQALVNKKEAAVDILIELLKRPYQITQADYDNALEWYAGYLEGIDSKKPVLDEDEVNALLVAVKNEPELSCRQKDDDPKEQTDDWWRNIKIDQEYKWVAAKILGEIADSKAVPVLVVCLTDPEAFVRAKAALALGQIGDLSASQALKSCASDFTIREEVRIALQELEATSFIIQKYHDKQRRYLPVACLAHLRGVVKIVKDYVTDLNIITAVYLHDFLEDFPDAGDELRSQFGESISAMVAALTESATERESADRKKLLSGKLNQMDETSLMIKLAERLDNLTSLSGASRNTVRKYVSETRYLARHLSRPFGQPLNTVHRELLKKIKKYL